MMKDAIAELPQVFLCDAKSIDAWLDAM